MPTTLPERAANDKPPPYPLGMPLEDIAAIDDPEDRYWQALHEFYYTRNRLLGGLAIVRAQAARDVFGWFTVPREHSGYVRARGAAAIRLNVRDNKMRQMLAAADDRADELEQLLAERARNRRAREAA